MFPVLKGFVIGFSIAAPVGPIGLLCIRRSITEGRLAGFVSGLGAATADACYGAVAALGLTAITHALVAQQVWLRFGGGVFLLYLGLGAIRARGPASGSISENHPRSLGAAYGSTFVLTLTNPMTIISFVGIFAGLGGTGNGSGWNPALMVVGVFCGSAAWWVILSSTASWLGQRLQSGGLRFLNWVAGATLVGFGLWQLFATVQSLR